MNLRRLPYVALAAALPLSLAAAPAAPAASSKLTIRGAGYGHGVGMSQYGAFGMARQGWGYERILRHYYTGTDLSVTDPNRQVRVLLRSGSATVSFRGAAAAGGRALQPERTYFVRSGAGGSLVLLSPSRRRLARFGGPLQATGPAGLSTGGRSYRGLLEFRAGSAGVNVINAVGLEDYVRGVVAWESPPSWPIEALKAQAVAARTYAITTSKGGAGWDQYADTRSQVYGGITAEAVSSNRAVAETSGHVVTYGGQPVVTYFFSTSGGRTEDVENVWTGASPSPWLRSVEDPYDDASPRHRWKPIRMTLRRAQRKLSGLVQGRLRGIDVLRRGRSPRIVVAEVVGSRGRTRVSGATLRQRFGLFDTWAFFTTVSSRRSEPPAEPPAPEAPAPEAPAGAPTGGAVASAARSGRAIAGLSGRISPARRGTTALLEQRRGSRWEIVGAATVGAGGRYSAAVRQVGVYRVRVGAAVGPAVRIR